MNCARSAGSFTTVPGWANVGMGLIGATGAYLAHGQTEPTAWLGTWLGAASAAFALGLLASSTRTELPACPCAANRPAGSFSDWGRPS